MQSILNAVEWRVLMFFLTYTLDIDFCTVSTQREYNEDIRWTEQLSAWPHFNFLIAWKDLGYPVAQFFEALCYHPGGRGFDTRWNSRIFHLVNPSDRALALRSTQHLTEMCTGCIRRSEGDRCVRLSSLSLSCANCLEMLKVSTSWKPKACSGM